MNLSLTAFFNLRLAHIAPVGYAKAVSFSQPSWNVPRGLPVSQVAQPEQSGGTGRSVRARAARLQVHRTNRRDMTPLQRRRHDYNVKYAAAKRAERQLRFVIMEES